MVHLEKLNQISYTPDGDALAWYDLSVSTAAELPALNSVVFGAKIQAPSRAQIIQADEPTIVTLDDNGTWYPEQSSSSASTLSAPLSTGKTLKPAVIEPESFEPDEPEEQGIDESEPTESEVTEDER